MMKRYILLIFIFAACGRDLSDNPIPIEPFPDIRIDLNLPEYLKLKTDHGYHYLNDGGVRGIILYRQNITTYYAYERNCSYHPLDACATVDVDASTLFMIDHCCSSTFSLSTGEPTGGIAWRPLRKYYTALNNSLLTITAEIVE